MSGAAGGKKPAALRVIEIVEKAKAWAQLYATADRFNFGKMHLHAAAHVCEYLTIVASAGQV